ncbi:MAG: hypothetical protein U0992_10325 [Planctomycetaceae bacterium]
MPSEHRDVQQPARAEQYNWPAQGQAAELAVQEAAELIRDGDADMMLAGAVEIN